MLREESDGFFNIRAVSFLTVAVFLTVFSVAYGNWYYSQITSFATVSHACETDADCDVGEICLDYVCALVPVQSDNSPPIQVVEEVSESVQTVSQSSSYAESIGEIVETQPVSESDLIRYRSNLEAARRTALEAYAESYDASSKYSSSLLNEYQESISIDLANIERQLRELDSLLTESVEERFEKQTKQALWTLEHEEDVVEASNTLEGYASLLPSGSLTDSLLPGNPGNSAFNVIVINPSTLTIARGESGNAEVVFKNLGSQVNHCFARTSGYNNWVDFYAGNYIATLPNLEEVSLFFNLNVPVSAEPGTYLFDLILTCDEGTVYGTTYYFEVEFNYDDLVERFYANHVTPNLNQELGEEGMIPPCGAEVQSCFSNTGGQSFCPNYILQCILEDNCAEFLFQCFYRDSAISYSNEQYYEFLNTYFTPYSETYQFTSQCTEDVVICNEDHENCPAYISLCISNHEVGQPAPPECLSFLGTCSNDVAPSYSEMRAEFIQTYVSPYVSLPQTCLQGVSASLDPYFCYNNYLDYYSCIIYQEYGSELGGSCSNYLSSCQGVQHGGSSGSSSGGSSGSSGSLGNIPSASTTTTGTSSEGGISELCRGDETCVALSETCLYPSYIAAVGLDLVDFGGFGYNPVTGQICYIGSSNVYLSNPFGNRPGGVAGTITEGDNPGNSNQVISIHFQNSGSEGDGRNYVAAMLYSLNGHLTLNFLSSPDYNGLEDKIYEFIQNLLYGESESSYITGMSLQQAEEIVDQSASVPWVLWIILFVMVISFVFFADLLSPYNVRLISSGKKALNKKDYALAIQNYNSLASSYAYDLDVKQDALNYLKDIREKVGSGKIELEFLGKDALPKIKVSKSEGIFSDYHRVQKMIIHALHDVKKSPKLAKSRMPVISEEYKRLSSKDKEKLASQYEGLVYKLRDLN